MKAWIVISRRTNRLSKLTGDKFFQTIFYSKAGAEWSISKTNERYYKAVEVEIRRI